MSVSKDTVMLKPDSRKVLIAMAEAEMESTEFAQAAGIPRNIVYTIRRGFYCKPKYLGAIWKAVDALPDRERQVIYFRYQEEKTLRETGEYMGVGRERIREIEYKALRYMERMRRKNGLISFMPDGLYRHNGVAEFNRTWTSSTELAALKIYDKDGAR